MRRFGVIDLPFVALTLQVPTISELCKPLGAEVWLRVDSNYTTLLTASQFNARRLKTLSWPHHYC